MISIICPTRKRREWFERFYNSVVEMSEGPFEIIAYIQEEDNSYDDMDLPFVKKIYGPRMVNSQLWNEAIKYASSDYFALLSDDMIIRTKGWDTMILKAFDKYPDKIAFVFGDDGDPTHEAKFGIYGILHRNWVDTVGYACAPYFSNDYWDTWLNEVSEAIGRKVYVPFMIEHMHFSFGKAELDDTKREMLENHKRDNVEQIYESKKKERQNDAVKLRKFIKDFRG